MKEKIEKNHTLIYFSGDLDEHSTTPLISQIINCGALNVIMTQIEKGSNSAMYKEYYLRCHSLFPEIGDIPFTSGVETKSTANRS